MALYGSSLQHSAMPLDGGGFVNVVITTCEATQAALMHKLATINPAAFRPTPVPHDLAAAMLRDGVADAGEPPARSPPSNALKTGIWAEIDEVPADDDEGERDFTACRVEGGCE